uniref:Uncharacterized protein n=1 Tax=Rhizophora mucronata TaxID=61149 RepID=A0A2P2QB80_RHIMU
MVIISRIIGLVYYTSSLEVCFVNTLCRSRS